MRYAKVRLDAIKQRAEWKAEGYEQDVLSAARTVTDTHALIPEDRYKELRAKYTPTQGPGTELKKLLKTIGIEAKPGCKCNKRAQTMDEKGCDWCAENIDLISAWLQEEAERRGLPYIPTAGKWIINLAIKRARRGIGE